MITYVCPNCGKSSEADEELAGSETVCGGCEARTIIPIDLPCEDGPAPAGAKTVTLDELAALRKGEPKAD
jgi:hypothetical protein